MGVTLSSKSHNYEHVNTKEIFSRKSHFREKWENFFSLSIVSDKKNFVVLTFLKGKEEYFGLVFFESKVADRSG